jgi:hypothetical protein
MADITIPYSSNFVAGGDETSEVLDDLLRNQTNTYAWLTSLRRQQYSATPPSNPNTGDVWRCSTTGGGYEANKTYRYSGTAWEEDSVSSLNIPTRNTVIQGPVDISGNLTLFAGGSGLACDLSECIVTWMGGNNGTVGAIDIIAEIPSTTGFWSGLPQDSTINLYIDFNDNTDTATGGYSTIAPVYQNYAPSHSAGKHWLDYNKGQVWESNGSVFTQKYRVFVGTATTNTLGVTAVSVYPYNVLRQDVEGNATTATALETARTINGVSFNGSANITIPSIGFTGLKITNGGTPDSQVAVTTTDNPYTNAALNLTISTGSAGANALDAGTVANSTWYSVWAIYNGTTVAGLLSTSATSPTLPDGYTFKTRLGWVRTDGSSNLYRTLQYGSRAQYVRTSATNTAALRIIISGTQGSPTTPTYVAASVTDFIPPTATNIIGVAYAMSSGNITMVAPCDGYSSYNSTSPLNPPPVILTPGTGSTNAIEFNFILESTNIYYAGHQYSGVNCLGWEDNI